MNFTNKWSDYRDILLACWWTPGYWQHISSLPGLQFYKDAQTASHFCCLKPFLFLGLNPAIPGFDSAAVNLSHNVTAFYPSLPTFDHWKQQTYLSRNAHPVGWFRTGEPWSTKGGVVALHSCKHSKIHPQHRHGIAAASLPGGTQAQHTHLLCHKLQLFTTQQPFPATNTYFHLHLNTSEHNCIPSAFPAPHFNQKAPIRAAPETSTFRPCSGVLAEPNPQKAPCWQQFSEDPPQSQHISERWSGSTFLFQASTSSF